MSIWKSKAQSWAAADSPWAVHTAGGLSRQVFANATFPQFRKTLLATLPMPPLCSK